MDAFRARQGASTIELGAMRAELDALKAYAEEGLETLRQLLMNNFDECHSDEEQGLPDLQRDVFEWSRREPDVELKR